MSSFRGTGEKNHEFRFLNIIYISYNYFFTYQPIMVSQTKFNMSAATLERLDQWLKRAMYYYSVGDLLKYFHAIKNVKLNAMFKFIGKGQRHKLREYEMAFLKQKSVGKKWAIAEKYHEILLDYMDKYGLLLPDRIDDLDTAY